jgi:hypothetical protein
MSGVDPYLKDYISAYLSDVFDDLSKSLLLHTSIRAGKNNLQQMQKNADEIFKEFRARFRSVQSAKFINPVLDSVEALPLDELASMAKALVNLTSFKRRVTMDPESVGGPIDVAVITKGDGFIWIERKHYFKPELNHQFFKNYYD